MALTVNGGSLTLTGANTYSGTTTVSLGTLSIGVANPSNEGSTVAIAATGATLNLAYAGTDTVDKLFIGGVQQPAGIYGKSGSTLPTIGIAQITGDGTLTVTSGPPANNYASWAASQVPPVTGGETGDSDNDGVKNLVEYALVDGGERGVLSGNTITFTKRADAITNGDVKWIIETSETLLSGSWTDAVTQLAGNPAATISYTFTPSTPPKKFARLKVNTSP